MSNDNQPNTSVSAGLHAMISAAQSGGDLRTAFNSPESVQISVPPVSEDIDKKAGSEPTENQDTVSASESQEENSVDSQTTAPDEEAQKEASVGDIEEITFTDHKGRRTVKVDFSDRDKVKKLASLAYGSRKFQVERDQARQEIAKEREEKQKLAADMTKFESIYEKQGLRGLAIMLEGQEGLDKLLGDIQAEKERWSEMTPAERNAEIRVRELESQTSKEQALREDYEKRLKELDERNKAADEKTFESKLHPSFDRYRYHGKLGDSVAEHKLDKALWADVMENLQPYVDKDVEITQAMIDKEFRKARSEWDKTVNKQVDKKTKVAVQKAKNNAQSKAQATVSKGMQTSSASEQFKKDINSGNIRDALHSFMAGKVKLTR